MTWQWGSGDRHLLRDRQPESIETIKLLGPIGEDSELREAQVTKDLRADAEVAAVHEGGSGGAGGPGGGWGGLFRFKFVEAVKEGEAARFLAQVDDRAFAGRLYQLQRCLQRLAGFGARSMKNVAEHMFGVHADEDRVVL